MRVASIQLITSRDKEENLRKILYFIEKSSKAGADLVIFPEASTFFSPPDEPFDVLYEKAEPINGSWVNSLKKSARENNINLVIGIYEKSLEERKVYLSAVYINREGEVEHIYRKTHLYDAFNFRESDRISKGDNKYEVFKIDGKWKAGLLVCYELRFPEISRTYALKGADILLVPAAWVKGYLKEEHLFTLAKARAIENTLYVVLSAQIGNIYTGYSAIIDPLGVPIVRSTEKEGIILGELEKERINEVRQTLPLLQQRREDLYFR